MGVEKGCHDIRASHSISIQCYVSQSKPWQKEVCSLCVTCSQIRSKGVAVLSTLLFDEKTIFLYGTVSLHMNIKLNKIYDKNTIICN